MGNSEKIAKPFHTYGNDASPVCTGTKVGWVNLRLPVSLMIYTTSTGNMELVQVSTQHATLIEDKETLQFAQKRMQQRVDGYTASIKKTEEEVAEYKAMLEMIASPKYRLSDTQGKKLSSPVPHNELKSGDLIAVFDDPPLKRARVGMFLRVCNDRYFFARNPGSTQKSSELILTGTKETTLLPTQETWRIQSAVDRKGWIERINTIKVAAEKSLKELLEGLAQANNMVGECERIELYLRSEGSIRD